MQNILLLDNYDSFTFNLLHYVEQLTDAKVDVFRNNEISLQEVEKYDSVILSPGPGLPKDAGILLPLIKQYSSTKKIFGVCLGLQAIGEAFGAQLKNLEEVLHGVKRKTIVSDSTEILFKKMPEEFYSARYHSWVVDSKSLPACFKIIAVDEANEIMAIRHTSYDLCGVQFHPESILTEHGLRILENWIHG